MAFTVGELAERSGVPATTLRYYDDLGLLVAERLPNGHRRYPPAALERLDLIRVSRALGLTLQEIATVLGPDGGPQRRDVARRKLDELDATLARLTAVRAVLAHLAVCEHGPARAAECQATVGEIWGRARSSSPEGDAQAAWKERRDSPKP